MKFQYNPRFVKTPVVHHTLFGPLGRKWLDLHGMEGRFKISQGLESMSVPENPAPERKKPGGNLNDPSPKETPFSRGVVQPTLSSGEDPDEASVYEINPVEYYQQRREAEDEASPGEFEPSQEWSPDLEDEGELIELNPEWNEEHLDRVPRDLSDILRDYREENTSPEEREIRQERKERSDLGELSYLGDWFDGQVEDLEDALMDGRLKHPDKFNSLREYQDYVWGRIAPHLEKATMDSKVLEDARKLIKDWAIAVWYDEIEHKGEEELRVENMGDTADWKNEVKNTISELFDLNVDDPTSALYPGNYPSLEEYVNTAISINERYYEIILEALLPYVTEDEREFVRNTVAREAQVRWHEWERKRGGKE